MVAVLSLCALAGPAQATEPIKISEFPIPTENGRPWEITAGPDGALWFTELDAGKIGRITTDGEFSELQIPTPKSLPQGITAGPDGALWFAEGAGKIGRVTTTGSFTEFPIPSGAGASDITVGPDGALWFTEPAGRRIGRITTTGSFTEFTTPHAGVEPLHISSGPDGALWFTQPPGRIWRVTTTGDFSDSPIATGLSPVGGITTGPDGALWVTGTGPSRQGMIGRVTTSGGFNAFPVLTAGFVLPSGITTGPDSRLWFTETFGDKIGRITITGSIREFPIPTRGGWPFGITAGPDGALWFTESASDKIGRITVGPGPPASLTLEPDSAHHPIDSRQCVTATVKDASGTPTPAIDVHFSVRGAVTSGDVRRTDPDGEVLFCYTGPVLPGRDLIEAYADGDDNHARDPEEPSGTATKNWILPSSDCVAKIRSRGRIVTSSGDRASFGGDARQSKAGAPSGDVTYLDEGLVTSVAVRSLSIQALTCNPHRTRAALFGEATIDGKGVHDFRIDLSDPAHGDDRYRIRLDTGYDSGDQALASGKVHIQAKPPRVAPVANGRIAFQSELDGNFDIYSMNPDGSDRRRLTNDPGDDAGPAWSPDGRKIAFISNRDGDYDIYIMDADGSNLTNLTQNSADETHRPAWSPDGKKIAFTTSRFGDFEIYTIDLDGTDLTYVTDDGAFNGGPDWSPDGTKIAYTHRDGLAPRFDEEIYTIDSNGRNPTNITDNSTREYGADWSPDGTRFAFTSDRESQQDIYAMNVDGGNAVNLSDEPVQEDFDPAWSPDGEQIAFVSLRDYDMEIYVMNADGSGQTRLTNHPGLDGSLAWQPIPRGEKRSRRRG